MAQIGDVLADRYELTEKLGRGGMAEVYRGRDRSLEREVAVKVLAPERTHDEDFIWRFEREARSAAALNHRNVVGVYDTGEDDGSRFIVMELVEGPTLEDVIREHGPLRPERVTSIAQGICDALEAAHSKELIHRDIKPANIMFDAEGAVKVADFGLARAAAATTQTATVYGSAPYMSPEQARGDDLDGRSDLYSLGCVMYAMITGSPLFEADAALAVVYQHLNAAPTPPSEIVSGVPEDLEAVVLKALEKDPDDRYRSAADLRQDLNRVAAGERPALGAVGAPTRRMGATEATTAMAGAPVGARRSETASPDRDHEQGPSRMVGSAVLLGVALLVLLGAFLLLRDDDVITPVDEPTPVETPVEDPDSDPEPEPDPDPEPEPEPEDPDPDPEDEPPPDIPPDDEDGVPPEEGPPPDEDEDEEDEEDDGGLLDRFTGGERQV